MKTTLSKYQKIRTLLWATALQASLFAMLTMGVTNAISSAEVHSVPTMLRMLSMLSEDPPTECGVFDCLKK